MTEQNVLKSKWEAIIGIITRINYYLKFYKDELKELCKEKHNLKEKIQKFNKDYSIYEELERFAIPVIGQISCGKSTILNYILNLKDALQIKIEKATKFICIIRHNSSLKGKNPQIYSVKFIQRAELKDHYNFIKGELIKGDIKKIIEQRNKDLEEKKIEYIPENFFYIIENYIPFFEGKNEKYAEFFEFMDIPGLNEISNHINTDNIYYEKVLPFIINNIKFSIFIFDTKFYRTNDSTQTYINFINKISKKQDYFNENNKYLKLPLDNSIYILNKIDLCDKQGGIKQENEDFKLHLKSLNVNLDKNKIILLDSKEAILEKDKYENFDNYLNYVIKSKQLKFNFIPNLIQNLENDFGGINILNDDEEEEEEEEEEKEENEKECEKITKLNVLIRNYNFEGTINKREYQHYKKEFDLKKNKKIENNNEKFIQLKSIILTSIKTTITNFIEFNALKNLEIEISKKIGIKAKINELDKKIPKISAEKILNNKDYILTLCELEIICKELKTLEPEHDFINIIYNNYMNVKKYIFEDYKYRIAFLGGISTGKSSIINSLIGYDLNLIPKSSAHTTKIILIIQYTQKEKNISLYRTKFDKHNKYSKYYYFSKEEKDLIAKGKEKVKEMLDKLNNETDEMKEIPYYILQTPIEFLDNNVEEQNRKYKVEFIDMPGLNKDNNLEINQDFLGKLINFTELFLFINNKNVIQQDNEIIIRNFFEKILTEKISFNLDSIVFVINQIDDGVNEIINKTNIKDVIQKFSKEINDIYKKITNNEWNNQLKFSDIIQRKKNFLFTYFSNEYYNKNKNKLKIYANCEEVIKEIIDGYKIKKVKIKKILNYLKKDYFDKLKNKNDYSNYYKSNSINIEIDSELIKISEILKKFKVSEEDIIKNKDLIKEMAKIFIFIKKNLDKIEFNYNFEEFFSILKTKINEKDLFPINNIILNFIIELNIYFKRISDNLTRYENKLEFKFDKSDKLTNTYNEFKNVIKKNYAIEKENLNNKLKSIIENLDDNNLYEEFAKKAKELSLFLSKTAQEYSIKMSKAHETEIRQYSIKTIEKNDYLISIIFTKESFEGKIFFSANAGIYAFASASFISTLISDISLISIGIGVGAFFFAGLIFFSLITLPLYFIVLKPEFLNRRKEFIYEQFKPYFEKLNFIKNQILDKVKDLYISFSRDIEIFEISQQKPMENIYNNKQKFEKTKKIFIDICTKFKESN